MASSQLFQGFARLAANGAAVLRRPVLVGIFTLTPAFALQAQDADRTGDVKMLGNCEGCVFEKQDFSDRRLTGIDFSGANLSDVIFDKATMSIAVFDGATLRDVSFIGTNLSGASFVGARLVDVIFDGANLNGAVFENGILERTDLQTALLCSTQIPGDKMDNSDCE